MAAILIFIQAAACVFAAIVAASSYTNGEKYRIAFAFAGLWVSLGFLMSMIIRAIL